MLAKCLALVLSVLVWPLAFADSQPGAPAQTKLADPLAGVVLNHTVTVLGHDFYQYFLAAWRDKDVNDRFAITIHERPSARLGSQVWVQFGQKKIFQTTLPPSRSQLKAIGVSAAEAVHEAVVSADVQRLLFRDADLAADEI